MKEINPFIRIIRTNTIVARGADLEVYIDGIKKGVVKHDTYLDFDVSEGLHEIYVKMEWVKSTPLTVRTIKSDKSVLAMKAFKVGLPTMSVWDWLIKLTINHKSGISLTKAFDDRIKKT